MNREEMKYLCISLEDKTINGMINAKELESQFEQYANKRVIDELEKLVMNEQKEIECDGDTYHILYTHDFSKRIKELKQ